MINRISRLREAGLLDQLLRTTIRRRFLSLNSKQGAGKGSYERYAHSMRGNPSQEAVKGSSNRFYRNVALFNMSSLFLFWAFGVFHCSLVFALEYLFDYFCGNWILKWFK